jgi:hypothetical protein
MNKRRFTAMSLPCFRPKGYHTSVREETTALRDFDPTYVGFGSWLCTMFDALMEIWPKLTVVVPTGPCV